MDFKYCINSCCNPLALACLYKTQEELLCPERKTELINSSKDGNFIKTTEEFYSNSDNQSLIISKIIARIKQIEEERLSFLSHHSKIMSMLNEYAAKHTENLFKKLSFYETLLKAAKNGCNLTMTYRKRIVENEELDEDLEFAIEEIKKKKKTKTKTDIKIYEILPIYKENPIFLFEEPSSEQNLYFFKRFTKNLVELNTSSLITKLNCINIKENQGECPSVCMISNSQLFISGGLSTDYLSSSYLIDIKTMTAEILQNSRKRAYATGSYFKEKVYIFGGHDTKAMKNSDVFDLRSKTWISLPDLPTPQSCTSTLALKNRIFIDCGGRKAYIFDTEKNLYTDPIGKIKKIEIGVFIKDGEKILCIENEVNLSREEDLKKWKKVAKAGLTGIPSSSCVKRGRCAFFVLENCKVYQIHLDNYEVKMILKV